MTAINQYLPTPELTPGRSAVALLVAGIAIWFIPGVNVIAPLVSPIFLALGAYFMDSACSVRYDNHAPQHSSYQIKLPPLTRSDLQARIQKHRQSLNTTNQ